MAAPAIRPAWLMGGAALLLVAVAAAISLSSLWERLNFFWTQVYGPFAHGYLVAAMSLTMAYRFWRVEPVDRLSPSWVAAPAFVAVVAALAVTEAFGLSASRLVLLPPLVGATLWWLFGWPCARRMFWPVAFLYCALPQWSVLDRPLQWLTTQTVQAAVQLSGIPAYIDGNFFQLPAGVFEIALGCSGLNYLITALSLFAFYGLMYLDSWHKRLPLLAVALGAALVSNWIRVYLLIAVGYASDMQHYLIAVEHHYFGWILFALAMWPVLIWARHLEGPEREDRARDSILPRVERTTVLAAMAAALVLFTPQLLALIYTGSIFGGHDGQ